jgi:hypothetical protein
MSAKDEGRWGALSATGCTRKKREEGEDGELPANPFWSLWPHECLDQMKDGYHRQGSSSALLTCHKTWRRGEILVITLNDHCNAEPKFSLILKPYASSCRPLPNVSRSILSPGNYFFTFELIGGNRDRTMMRAAQIG